MKLLWCWSLSSCIRHWLRWWGLRCWMGSYGSTLGDQIFGAPWHKRERSRGRRTSSWIPVLLTTYPECPEKRKKNKQNISWSKTKMFLIINCSVKMFNPLEWSCSGRNGGWHSCQLGAHLWFWWRSPGCLWGWHAARNLVLVPLSWTPCSRGAGPLLPSLDELLKMGASERPGVHSDRPKHYKERIWQIMLWVLWSKCLV